MEFRSDGCVARCAFGLCVQLLFEVVRVENGLEPTPVELAFRNVEQEEGQKESSPVGTVEMMGRLPRHVTEFSRPYGTHYDFKHVHPAYSLISESINILASSRRFANAYRGPECNFLRTRHANTATCTIAIRRNIVHLFWYATHPVPGSLFVSAFCCVFTLCGNKDAGAIAFAGGGGASRRYRYGRGFDQNAARLAHLL